VHEISKASVFAQAGRSDHAESQPLASADNLSIELREPSPLEQRPLVPSPHQRIMERFGKAVAELLNCGSCYVAIMSPATGGQLEEVRVGNATIDPSCTTTMARIARKGAGADCALLEPINARTAFVRKLIGPEPGSKSHSVIGRFASRERTTVVFVAGWRSAALVQAEIPCLGRAVRTLWETINSSARQALAPDQAQAPDVDAQILLEELALPALVTDEGLNIHGVNRGGRALLAKGELLKIEGGKLVGASGSVTDGLRRAVREALVSRAGQVSFDRTVPLSTERQQFAFAKVGAVPTHRDARKALVIVPQFDEVLGAQRIADAFGLNWAEERIIARILQFQCPRDIGADLRLTEATVRTYTKRIMLKLGINRQSEFFLLYHLTQSPFGAGKREKAASHALSECPPKVNDTALDS
jgi:DNA-binding CsgD family transcriptional regulator